MTSSSPPFFLSTLPNILSLPLSIIALFLTIYLYYRQKYRHQVKRNLSVEVWNQEIEGFNRRRSQLEQKQDENAAAAEGNSTLPSSSKSSSVTPHSYQFTSQATQIIRTYRRYKLKKSQSLYDELMQGIESGALTAGNPTSLLDQIENEDLFAYVAPSQSRESFTSIATDATSPIESTVHGRTRSASRVPLLLRDEESEGSIASSGIEANRQIPSATTLPSQPKQAQANAHQRHVPSLQDIQLSNHSLLSANQVVPLSLKSYALNQILDPEEILLWCDCPLYSAKKGRTLRNCAVLYMSAFTLSCLFGVIAAYIVEYPLDALSTSFMGLLSSALLFLLGLYYTISLKSLNVLYMITNQRIIFCKKKGFFRRRLQKEVILFEELPGVLQVTKYTQQRSQRNGFSLWNRIARSPSEEENSRLPSTTQYGDLHFQRNFTVMNQNVNQLWKMRSNSKSTFKGFRSVMCVDELEELMSALIELKKKMRGLENDAAGSSVNHAV